MIAVGSLLSACTFSSTETVATPPIGESEIEAEGLINEDSEPSHSAVDPANLLFLQQGGNLLWSQTNVRGDGNRVVAGNGAFPNKDFIDIELPAEPTWVVGFPFKGGALWVTTLLDGSVHAFSIINNGTSNKKAEIH